MRGDSIMKKLIIFALIALLVLLPATALAEYTNVFDYAMLFSDDELDMLQERASEFVLENGVDIVILTVDDDEGKSSRVIADDYYDYNGFKTDGLLLLLNMDAREVYISTAGTMIDILNDSRIEALLDIQYDYLVNGDYFGAMYYVMPEISAYIESGPVPGQHRVEEGSPEASNYPENGIYGDDYYTPQSEHGIFYRLSLEWVILSVAAGVLAAVVTGAIIASGYKKKYKPVAYDYSGLASLTLSRKEDELINRYVTTRHIPKPDSSSGGGGGSSSSSTTHTSSSGSSHGGGGRSF